LGFLVQCVEALPDHLHVQPVTCHGNVMLQRLEVEADEMVLSTLAPLRFEDDKLVRIGLRGC
jgi:hypothetical protein